MDLLQAAAVEIQGDYADLQQALLTAQAKNQAQGRGVDPTFRLYRDQVGMQWADQMTLARKWAFLATRALEYTTNQSFANAGEVFADATAGDLSNYLSLLSSTYQSDQLTNGWDQDRVDILSLRRDVFGYLQPVPDPAGGTMSPEQQFEALLLSPKSRDAEGNLKLAFDTEAAAGGLDFFSSDVCEDRIADIKMNLVSSALTGSIAYVGLTQQGEARLADCAQPGTATSYTLSTKAAQVTAGLNLPRTAETDPSYPANTDLYERPVLASSWILSIDTHGEPQNAWVDLGQIEDIEIWIHHRARTVQSN